MSLGATTSAPASACETAVRASSSSVASLSTTPSSRSTPQCPWLVYSQRQRSAMTSRSGCAALIARVASWTMPSSSHAPEPCSSLSAGQAEQQHGGDASAAASPASSTAPSIERWSMPGSEGIGVAPRAAGDDEHGVDEVRDRELGLAHEPAQQAGLAQAPQAGRGKRHAVSLERRWRHACGRRDSARAPHERSGELAAQAKRRSASRGERAERRASAPAGAAAAQRTPRSPPLSAASSASSVGLNGNAPRSTRMTS